MYGTAQGVFVLAFSLAITGLLPGVLGTIVIWAAGLLAVAWVLMVLVLPILQGFFDLLR